MSRRLQRMKRDLWMLRGISLIFAIFLWIAVIGGKRSEITKDVILDFKFREGTIFANNVPSEVSFRIRGPRAFLKEMEEKDLHIPVDLTQTRLGGSEINFSEDMLEVPLGLEVLSVNPKTFLISLDQSAKKRVPVRASIQGSMPEGFKVRSVSVNPSTIEIEGPKKTVKFIESISTEDIRIDPTSSDKEIRVKLNLSEYFGVKVSENFDSVMVSINMDGPMQRKEISGIPVHLKVGSGKSAQEVNPKSVNAVLQPSSVNFVIEGPDGVMSKMASQAVQAWVEIPDSKKGRFKQKLLWQLPPQVKMLQRSTDQVLVRIQ